MRIRRFQEGDAQAVSDLIATTLRISNAKDYSPAYLEADIRALQPQNILERAGWTHFYVACEDENLIGCGAIGPYWNHEDESSLFTIFVLPDYQGKGIGRAIVQTLEQDSFFLRAKRIEIPASITATPFYRKLGYDFKNGISTPNEEGLILLEKFR